MVFTFTSFKLFSKRKRVQLFIFFLCFKIRSRGTRSFSWLVVDKWTLLCIDYDFHNLPTKRNFVAVRFIDYSTGFCWL